MNEEPEQLLTKRQLAELLQIHPRTLNRLIAVAHIPFIRVGGSVRFRLSEVMKALERA